MSRRRALGRAAQDAALEARRATDAPVPRPAPPARAAKRRAFGRFPLVAAVSSVGLVMCSATDALSRATLAPSIWFFWAGIAVIVAPIFYRLCSAEANVAERIALVCLLGLGLYVVKLMRDPFGFTMPDEFIHAYNAQQILQHHALFTVDPFLPVTAKYPGLEGATSALMSLTGMSSFGSGLIVIGAARLSLMLALFALFATISGSPRVAGLGAAAYAANSNFLLWGAQFSYESLALPLMVVVLAAVLERSKAAKPRRAEWTVPILLLIIAIAVTHHLTSYVLVIVLVGIALLPLLPRGIPLIGGGRMMTLRAWPFALFAALVTSAWLVVVASKTVGYITPVLSKAFTDTLHTITGESAPRAPFQSSGGLGTPLPEKILTFVSLALLAIALPFGLTTAWRRHKRNPIVVIFSLAALGFFGVLGLRAAPSAWEVANRADEFLFIGLAFVLGYAAVNRLRSVRTARVARFAPAFAAAYATVAVVGGAITGWPASSILAAPVQVSIDHRQIDSETLAVGRWVGAHISQNGFAAPAADARTILFYGGKRVLTANGVSLILSTPSLESWQLPTLRRDRLRYAVADRRERSDDAANGYGFSVHPPGGPRDVFRSADVAGKFDGIPAPRVYDSGNIQIFDLGLAP